ncbi:MAG TPA: OmpH family outer membrane protein [Candidatus Sulfotelmatobacter sp.]|jgi:outer membrane protein|nr:OmpH family outer membrane protein [Candidatus Sulfotelmatobacter sp.]
MTSKFLRLFLAVAVVFAISALAQTSSATPSTSPAGAASGPVPTVPAITGTKIGAINIEGAIFGSNEGRKEMETLGKKFEPKQAELKSQNDELEALKKQLSTQEGKLNEDAAANLKKQIESKQKVFDRAVQDAQEEFGTQQQEIANKVLQKLAPMIVKYAADNGYGMIIDTSKPWPQSPIVMAGEGVDLTKAVVDIYNAQSGVPAPATTGAAPKPAAPRPAVGAGATKPATPAAGGSPK